VVEEWSRRVEAEYRSTAVSSQTALWLVQVGASPDLVKDALRIAREELGHATGSHRVYLAACRQVGVEPRPTALDRRTLELERTPDEPLEHDVARVCVEGFCLGETVAVRLFHEMRRRCDVPPARRVLDRVLRDEVGHRDFGWSLLGWLLAHPMRDALRALVVRELPGFVASLRRLYAPPGRAGALPLTRDEVRWGLLDPSRYGEIVEASYRRDIVPRLARLGVTVGVDARLSST
jgi:hypothetical protein